VKSDSETVPTIKTTLKHMLNLYSVMYQKLLKLQEFVVHNLLFFLKLQAFLDVSILSPKFICFMLIIYF
jgi:uncharacterized membrane protein